MLSTNTAADVLLTTLKLLFSMTECIIIQSLIQQQFEHF